MIETIRQKIDGLFHDSTGAHLDADSLVTILRNIYDLVDSEARFSDELISMLHAAEVLANSLEKEIDNVCEGLDFLNMDLRKQERE